MIVLVDTCVWSFAFRRASRNLNSEETKTLRSLEEIILEGRAQMLGLVRQELLSGLRHKAQFDLVRAATRTFDDIALEIEDYEDAAIAANRCRAAGIAGSSIDFLLCAVALRRRWAILTTDRDFSLYQRQLHFTLLPG